MACTAYCVDVPALIKHQCLAVPGLFTHRQSSVNGRLDTSLPPLFTVQAHTFILDREAGITCTSPSLPLKQHTSISLLLPVRKERRAFQGPERRWSGETVGKAAKDVLT
eukprot:scpid26269/ scgid28012/ 